MKRFALFLAPLMAITLLTNCNGNKTFTIDWKNDDGTLLSTTKVKENEMPEYDKKTPSKPADSEYVYTFAGWEPAIVKATKDTTYIAKYTKDPKKFNVNVVYDVEEGEVTGAGKYAPGTTVVLTATPTDPDKTVRWTSGGVFISDELQYSFTMQNYDVELNVEFVSRQKSGKIKFGSSDVKIDSPNVEANDDTGRLWTITTEGTTSFTANANYYQVGSSSKPATSITFATTFNNSYKFMATTIEAKFGGFTGTAGNVTIKVDDSEVGTGQLNGKNDVIISSNKDGVGKTLTITITNISKGVKCYYNAYTIS